VRLSSYLIQRTINVYTISSATIGLSAALVASRGIPDLWISIVSFAAPMLGRIATFMLNDYFDREADKHTRPWRPLVSGAIKPKSAIIFASTLVIVGFLLTITLYNLICLSVAFLALGIALAYNMSHKRRYIMHGILALNEPLIVIYGYAASAYKLTATLGGLALLMALITYMDSLPHSIVFSVPDVPDDKAGGMVTASVKVGVENVLKINLGLFVSSIALGILPFTLGYLNMGYLVCFLTTRVMLSVMYGLQLKNPSPRSIRFTLETQGFFRMFVCLSFLIGILPLDVVYSLASIIILMIISTPLAYFKSVFWPRKL
jgi:geranylgeranylglycerol-phosphate geranylgeranyltransferase